MRATLCGARSDIFTPLNSTSPLVAWTKEAISLNRVDLPAPFGPITDRISPLATSKLMLLFAVSPPYFLVRPRICSICVISSFAVKQTENTVGQHQHHGDHRAGIDQQLIFLGDGKQIPAEIQQEGADHRAGDKAQAADKAVQHEVDAIVDDKAGRVDRLRDGDEHRPRQATEET